MPGTPGRKIIKHLVMEHFQKAPGVPQYVSDLAKQFNVSEHQMQECVAGIIRTESLPGLSIEVRGRSWMYRPGATSASSTSGKRIFEEIGQARDGIVIQEADSGKLFLAREL